MPKASGLRSRRQLRLAVILASVVVLTATLTAGLWPFAFHIQNGVSWSSSPRGLRFKHYSTAVTESPFNGVAACTNKEGPFSLEVWLQPEKASGYGTVMVFDSDEQPDSLAIRQSLGDVEFVHLFRNPTGKTGIRHLYIDDVFSVDQPRLLTVAIDDRETRVFVDGKRIQRTHNLGVRCGDLRGTLILGTATSLNDTFSGTLLGLAVYGRAIDAADAANHYQAWTANRPADLKQVLNADALYLFNEGTGRIARNSISDQGDIILPENYSVRRKRFLQPFWEEFSWDRAYVTDLAINVVGFIPMGFCMAAFLGIVWRCRHSVAIAILLCFATSLVIEVLQAFMPLRYSGTTDLITNTSGGLFGAVLYQLLAGHLFRWQPELEEGTD